MKNLKNSRSIAGQSNAQVRKSQKHDANLQKNSTLYFQIGLILCLLGTYGLFEMKFENKIYIPEPIELISDEVATIDVNYIVEEKVSKKEPIERQSQKLVTQKPVIVDNFTSNEMITDIVVPEQKVINILNPNALSEVTEPTDEVIEIFNMVNVEVVPIYPGCEKATSNKERLKCMSQKLGKLIQRKFNTDLASDLGLSGLQKIDVQFKIDKNGLITEIKTRAPLQQLEDEAKRVVNKIPRMTPGKQRNEPVSVMYNLPIMFQVQ